MNPHQKALNYFLRLSPTKRSELIRHRSSIDIPHTPGIQITVDCDQLLEYDHIPVIEMLEWAAEEYGELDTMEITYKEQYNRLLDLVERMFNTQDTLHSAKEIEEILRKRIIQS
jgi:hypothetical protein